MDPDADADVDVDGEGEKLKVEMSEQQYSHMEERHEEEDEEEEDGDENDVKTMKKCEGEMNEQSQFEDRLSEDPSRKSQPEIVEKSGAVALSQKGSTPAQNEEESKAVQQQRHKVSLFPTFPFPFDPSPHPHPLSFSPFWASNLPSRNCQLVLLAY